mgnify:CR=1 FL=1
MYGCYFFRQHNIQGPTIQQGVSSLSEDQRRHSNTSFFPTCHPAEAKEGYVKGEASRLLSTNSSIKTFEQNINTFKKYLMGRGYPQNYVHNTLS